MEVFYGILGIAMVYSVAHFFLIQKKGYNDRTDYEKVVSVVSMIVIALLIIGSM